MKFVTNKISTAESKTFAQMVQDYRQQKEAKAVKTASASQQVKVARTDPKQEEGESSGQLDVEPLHQKGESTPSPHKKEDGGKETAKNVSEAGDAKPVKKAEGVQDKDNENNDDADESGQTKADFPKLTNDPEAGKHRDGDGDQKKASEGKKVKEANLANLGDKKAEPFGSKKDDEEKAEETKPCSDEEEEKKASSAKMEKVANLDSKSKQWLRDYWSKQYPAEYVDAMLADK